MATPAAFAAQYPFSLDDFQVTAIDAVDAGRSVLVAAPTGSGKTVVAEFAIERALDRGGKAFYTTPLKALSNQKYSDLVARHGADRVGLLTGDNAVNSEAPVVVMTTEVLRNMLYERSGTLHGLMTVIMDEVHYLQDPYRGAVWEEVLIHLALSASVVCLSATISNAEEFGEWIQTLRGETTVVIEERRPVPLEHHYLIGRRLHPMHIEQEGILLPNPYVVSLDQQELRVKEYRRVGSNAIQTQRMNRPREGHRSVYVPRREEVVEILAQADMLPAIYFVFSRAGCDRSVQWLRESGVRLTTRAEADRIRERAESRAAWIDEEDLVTLGFYEFLDGLTAGVAAHHAGMLPVFKETVEELFEAGLVKVVFATETLSLGINMPARTVVIEDLWKFQGERHEILTPGEYTQLTGRAGRRGIDALGHAVVVYQRQVPFERVAGLAATRTYDLNSSFRPSYNMAVNLVRNYDREQAHQLLNSSFAQFLADRGVVTLERQREHDRKALEGYRTNLVCHLGDFDEYWSLLSEAKLLREEDRRGRERGSRRGDPDRGGRPPSGRGDPSAPGPASRPRGGLVLEGREADGALGGPVVPPTVRQGLRRSADGAHPDRLAAVGELPQRPVPARCRLEVGVPARQAPTGGPALLRPRGREEGSEAGGARGAASVRVVPRSRQARALGHAGRRARCPDERCATAYPDPHGDARSPVRSGAGGAGGARLRRGVGDHAQRSHARADLRRGRPVGGGVALVEPVRRSLALGGRVPAEYRGLRVAGARALAGGAPHGHDPGTI